MTSDEDLIRVTLLALESNEFRQAWDMAVRGCADRVTGEITGLRMAGATGGSFDICWDEVNIPILASLGQERTRAAFARVVTAEVERRVEAMTSPGSFG